MSSDGGSKQSGGGPDRKGSRPTGSGPKGSGPTGSGGSPDPDRSSETREGFVPSGKRGWLKVGGAPRGAEIQPVTPGWAKKLREKEDRA
jgi:hypothetical protein